MKINEIFKSCQGEGAYIGEPFLFIRTSGCTRNCDFCDTKYHTKGDEKTTDEIVDEIIKSGMNKVVWTGGEPALFQKEIYEIIIRLNEKHDKEIIHQLESNGDILIKHPECFEYITISPKDLAAARNADAYFNVINDHIYYDIKVVTDLEMNKELIKYATMLMPLTTYDDKIDLGIKQKVWNYCTDNKIKYAPRIHVDVWGKSVGV